MRQDDFQDALNHFKFRQIPVLTLAVLLVYAAIIAASLFAAFQAQIYARPIAEKLTWLCAAAFFLGLAVMRIFDAENRARNFLRELARERGLYDNRHFVQEPLFLILLAVATLLGWLAFRWIRGMLRSRPVNVPITAVFKRRLFLVQLAQIGMLAFIPVMGLRIVSLHNVDALLYGGPIKLNWILETGFCANALIVASLYCWWSIKRRKTPLGGR